MNNLLPLLLFLAAICLFSNGRNVRHETSAGSAAKSNRKVCILLCLTFDFVNTLQPQVKNAPSISHYWLGLGRFLYGNSSDNEPSSTIAKVAEHGRKLQPIDSVPPTIAVTSMYALPNYKGIYIHLYSQFGNSFASFFLLHTFQSIYNFRGAIIYSARPHSESECLSFRCTNECASKQSAAVHLRMFLCDHSLRRRWIRIGGAQESTIFSTRIGSTIHCMQDSLPSYPISVCNKHFLQAIPSRMNVSMYQECMLTEQKAFCNFKVRAAASLHLTISESNFGCK